MKMHKPPLRNDYFASACLRERTKFTIILQELYSTISPDPNLPFRRARYPLLRLPGRSTHNQLASTTISVEGSTSVEHNCWWSISAT